MISNENKNEVRSEKLNLKISEIDMENYKFEEPNNSKTKSFKQKRINIKNPQSNIQSEEEIIHVRNKLIIKDFDIKTNDFMNNNEIDKKINQISNNEIIQVAKKEEKKGFLERTMDWLSFYFQEIPLLWKKEELIQGYDANGNIVYRPKNKIPTKEKNNVNIEKNTIENEANSASVDFTMKGINYGVYFN